VVIDQTRREFVKLFGFIVLSLAVMSAGALKAETIDVYDSHGGRVRTYDAEWAARARQGVSVRITGPCQSACTVLLRHIPRSRICVTPEASFRFHLGTNEDATRLMWSSYQADIKGWIKSRGGLHHEFLDLEAPEIYRFFKRCRS
jgi:hypothetical protein